MSFLSIKDLEARWKVSRAAIYRLIAAGTLQPVKIGRSVRFSLAKIEAVEASSTREVA